MKCHHCHREIGRQEQAKMVCEYKQEDGSIVAFGLLQPAGSLKQAKGRLLRAYMWKCWQVVIKRTARGGDPTLGRGVLNSPTAYEIEEMIHGVDGKSTEFLTEQSAERLAIAKEMGVSSDSWVMRELMRALDKGVVTKQSPGVYFSTGYLHTHQRPVDKAGLVPHLEYAHGWPQDMDLSTHNEETLRRLHDKAHVEMTASLIDSARRQDPGSTVDEGPELEWPAGGTSTVEL